MPSRYVSRGTVRAATWPPHRLGPPSGSSTHALPQPPALSVQLIRLLGTEPPERRCVGLQLALPLVRIHAHRLLELAIVVGQPGPVEILIRRCQAQRRLPRMCGAGTALEDPLQDAHVLPEARPDEPAVRALAKPVYAEDTRRMRDRRPHGQPVAKVVADVVAAERQHREGVAPHLAN